MRRHGSAVPFPAADAVLATRLANQRLTNGKARRPEDLVAWLGAVQSQDYQGAAWALGLRLPAVTAADVDAAFAAGRLLRTHVLRPTWHFVAADDVHWMLAVTGPRVQAMNAGVGRRLGLEAKTLTRARGLMERALDGGRYLTRAELAAALRAGGIAAAGQALAHLVMHAELTGAICSGPRRGKQFTYALLAERAPRGRRLGRDEGLAALARRYFQSHGPATVHDFAWWSGLTISDARRAIDAAAVGEQVLAAPPGRDRVDGAHYLLPNYDEYLIAYRHRGAVIDPDRIRNLGVFTAAEYPHHVVLDGRLAGSWRREMTAAALTVRVRLFVRPTAAQRTALRRQASRYASFLGLPQARLEVDA